MTHWDDALNDRDAEPAHVARLGTVDVKGIEGGTEHAERAIKYATKYITKDLVDQTIIKPPSKRPTPTGSTRSCRSCRVRPGAPTGCSTAPSPTRPTPA